MTQISHEGKTERDKLRERQRRVRHDGNRDRVKNGGRRVRERKEKQAVAVTTITVHSYLIHRAFTKTGKWPVWIKETQMALLQNR